MKLMPHQIEGVKFALARRGSLIAGEPGTGKTAMAIVASISMLHAHPEWKRVLLTVPASLRENWVREWMAWSDAMPFMLDPQPTIGIVLGKGAWPDANVVVCSYEMMFMGGYDKELYSEPWDILICDESHMLKTPGAKRTKAVKRIKARRKMFLSGTPAPNRPVELFPQLSMLDPQQWGNWKYFVERYCSAKPGFNNSLDVSGSSNELELYRRLTQGPGAIMYRVTKEQCLALPEKQHRILEVPPPEHCKPLLDMERRLFTMRQETLASLKRLREGEFGDEAEYKANAAKLNSTQTASMAEMSRIRQELATAKAPLIVDHAKALLESGVDKLVIAGHHRNALAIIADSLNDYGSLLYYGGVAMSKRQGMVDKFQTDPTCRVICLGIGAGGVGITLVASSYVVMCESTWNTATNTQAIDRIHRIGAEREVKIDWIVFQNSLDAKVLQTCLRKDNVVDAIIDGKAPDAKPHPHGGTAQPKRDMKLIGANMSDAERRTAHAAIRHLAALDKDGARRANGAGFSKVDTMVGHQLASLESPSPAQYATMRQIAMKYRGQLSPSLRIDLLGALSHNSNATT